MPSQKKSSPSGAVLGIETATPRGSVALCSNGAVLGELSLTNPRSHSERLLPSVETLLKAASLTVKDLTAVSVSVGPGSFTGLRIGVAAAKGLAFSLGVPLFGIPTLEVLAANASPGRGPACAVIDARRGEVFAALFRSSGEKPVRVRRERIMTPAELAASLPPETLVLGDLPAELTDLLPSRGKRRVSLAPAHQNAPRAAVVALRGETFLAEGRPSETQTLVPLYLRPSDAEANVKRKARRLREGRRAEDDREKAC
jgi:tRNA threonylcarbamoyladenosine biosynthesis protein TsaB